MKDSTYDLIKNVALLVAPILVLVSSLCTIWQAPHCAELTASFAAIDTFLGAIVIVAKRIHDGKTEPDETDEEA